MNKVILCGNVVREPRYFPAENEDSQSRAHFAVALDRMPGRDDTKTDFPEVTVYGKLADVVSEHIGKGSKVLVDGALRTYVKEDRGENRTQMNVLGQRIEILSWVKNGDASDVVADAQAEEPVEEF